MEYLEICLKYGVLILAMFLGYFGLEKIVRRCGCSGGCPGHAYEYGQAVVGITWLCLSGYAFVKILGL